MTLLLLGAALLAAPAGASADEVECGDTITEDTTLTADVVCAEGEGLPWPHGTWVDQWVGLLVDADGVTLDLNGHRVGGTYQGGIGVLGHSDVTIQNGSTSAIDLVDTDDSRLVGLDSGMVELLRSNRNRIADSSMADEGGLSLVDSHDNLIEDSRLSGSGSAVGLSGSDRNQLRRNRMCSGMSSVLSLYGGSDANVIEDNVIPDRLSEWRGQGCSAYEDGILVTEDSAGNRLIGNTALGNARDGIHVENPATTLIGNIASYNGNLGIMAVAGVESGVNYARGNANALQCLNVQCLLEPPLPVQPPPGQAGAPSGAAPGAVSDLTPPLAKLAGKRAQRLGRAVGLSVRAASEDLWVSVAGKLLVAGAARVYRLRAVRNRFVARGSRLTLELVVPRRVLRAMRSALDDGQRVKAELSVGARDAAGNVSAVRRAVTIKR
jgi:parallel beta-helix repeat protein